MSTDNARAVLDAPLKEAYKAFADRCDALIEGEDMSAQDFFDAWMQEVEPRVRAAPSMTYPRERSHEQACH